MPLLFTRFCDLLSALEDLSTRDPPLLPARYRQRLNETIKSWFASHKVTINSPDMDAVALLSALFPAKRTDRVYNIQPPKLTKLLRRCLRLGNGRWPQLDQWKEAGRGDLGSCVERVLRAAEFPPQYARNRVTLQQVDQALATVAARCRFSAPEVRARELENDVEISTTVENIYQRLQSREAKWFTRMILKDYPSLGLTENMIYYQIDLRLRVAMQMYDHFEAAVGELRALPASQMADAGQGGWTQQCANDAHLLPPRIGTKLGPPKWIKAKGGVKHAVTVIDGRTMSMERKHDGEYCQIHIDLSKGDDCVQIFSKSGKDSTVDRSGVHKAIKDALRVGYEDCCFASKCILEGELLVSSERGKDVLEFHKIRKHVSRSGSFLGTNLDSQ
jgi:DNA ligase-4